MTPDELSEYERVKGTGKWKEFDAKQGRKLKREARRKGAALLRSLKGVKPMTVEEARAYWNSIPVISAPSSEKF
jgi:hypothetical protein